MRKISLYICIAIVLFMFGCKSAEKKPPPPPAPTPTEIPAASLKLSFVDLRNKVDVALGEKTYGSVSPEKPSINILITEDELSLWQKKKIVCVNLKFGKDSPYRCQEYVTIDRGKTRIYTVRVARAPAPNFSIKPERPTDENTVYAGDTVFLAAMDTEAMSGDDCKFFWFYRLSPPPVEKATILNEQKTVEDEDLEFGLASWMSLRTSPEEISRIWEEKVSFETRSKSGSYQEDAYGVKIFGPLFQSGKMGEGKLVEWTPPKEGVAIIYLIAINPEGYWGMAKRTLNVVDIRPKYWVLPSATLGREALDKIARWNRIYKFGGREGRSRDVDTAIKLLEDLPFEADTGQDVSFILQRSIYADAEIPLKGAKLDFGDGTVKELNPEEAEALPVLSHVYSEPGEYLIQLNTSDIMGLERNMSVTIRIYPAPVFEVDKSAEELEKVRKQRAGISEQIRKLAAQKMKEEKESKSELPEAMSSFDWMVRAVKKWCAEASGILTGISEDNVVIHHLHPKSNHLIDLFDYYLVDDIKAIGKKVYERDPKWLGSLREERGFDTTKEAKFPQGNVVFHYKLKRALVSHEYIAPFIVRRARLYGFVRLEDLRTAEILKQDMVEVEMGDIIAEGGGGVSGGKSWDFYPFDFFRVDQMPQGAREVVEDKSKTGASGSPQDDGPDTGSRAPDSAADGRPGGVKSTAGIPGLRGNDSTTAD